MPSLSHDAALAGAANRGGCCVARSKAVPRVAGGIQHGAFCEFLHDTRNVDPTQAASLNLPMAVHSAEQWAAAEGCLLNPRLEVAHRARLRVAAVGDANLAPSALLIAAKVSGLL